MAYYGIITGEWLFAMKERHCSACMYAENGRCTDGEKFLDLSCMLEDKKFKPIDLKKFIKRKKKNEKRN